MTKQDARRLYRRIAASCDVHEVEYRHWTHNGSWTLYVHAVEGLGHEVVSESDWVAWASAHNLAV